MIYLLEALWYSLLVVIKICWIPAAIILGVALIARFFGWVRRKSKK